MFGGLTAGRRAVYALLPIDEADNTVGKKKGETRKVATEAVNEVTSLRKELEHGTASMDKSAQAAVDSALANKDAAKHIRHAAEAMESTAEEVRNAVAILQEHTATLTPAPTPPRPRPRGAQKAATP